jgi:hypothetical protein
MTADGNMAPAAKRARDETRIRIDDAAREGARRLRYGDWDAEGTADVFIPRLLAQAFLAACGYRPGPHGGCIGPDGERYGSLGEATSIEVTAAALAAAEAGPDPFEEALRQIEEVAKVPVGQLLLAPEEQVKAMRAKLERIGNIAADREPDEDWPPALIEAVGSPTGDPSVRRLSGPPWPPRQNFGYNVERRRRERGYSLDTLAARSQIECGEIEEIIRGERKVLADEILLLAGALDVEPNALMEGIRWTPPGAGGSGFEITGGGRNGR